MADLLLAVQLLREVVHVRARPVARRLLVHSATTAAQGFSTYLSAAHQTHKASPLSNATPAAIYSIALHRRSPSAGERTSAARPAGRRRAPSGAPSTQPGTPILSRPTNTIAATAATFSCGGELSQVGATLDALQRWGDRDGSPIAPVPRGIRIAKSAPKAGRCGRCVPLL